MVEYCDAFNRNKLNGHRVFNDCLEYLAMPASEKDELRRWSEPRSNETEPATVRQMSPKHETRKKIAHAKPGTSGTSLERKYVAILPQMVNIGGIKKNDIVRHSRKKLGS